MDFNGRLWFGFIFKLGMEVVVEEVEKNLCDKENQDRWKWLCKYCKGWKRIILILKYFYYVIVIKRCETYINSRHQVIIKVLMIKK